jgi:hypothetical protein
MVLQAALLAAPLDEPRELEASFPSDLLGDVASIASTANAGWPDTTGSYLDLSSITTTTPLSASLRSAETSQLPMERFAYLRLHEQPQALLAEIRQHEGWVRPTQAIRQYEQPQALLAEIRQYRTIYL